MKILIIEDEKEISDSIVAFLKDEGFLCECASSFDEAREKINLYQYECVVVDIMLPDGNGLALIRELKANHSQGGIIVVSAKNSLEDKLRGLNLGADDYLTKPFHLPELAARIKSIIRRRKFKGEQLIEFHEIKINTASREVTVKNHRLDLTKKEYDLLIYFISNTNRVLTRESIAENLLGDQADMMDSFNFIYTHVKNLRKKIIEAGGTDYVHTVYAIGYKFGER